MQSERRWLPSCQRTERVELCLERGLTRRQAVAWRGVSVHRSALGGSLPPGQRGRAVVRGGGRGFAVHASPPARLAQRGRSMTEQRQRTGWGPRVIAPELGMAAATVSRCLQRRGMSRRPPAPRDAVRRLSGPAPAICCRWTPSAWPIFAPRTCPHRRALPHQRGAQGRVGWEFCHSIVDDHSRLAYTELCPDEKAPTVTAFVERALAFLPTTTSPRAGCRPIMPGATPTTARYTSCSTSTASNTAASRPAPLNRVARQPGPMPRSRCRRAQGERATSLGCDRARCRRAAGR